MGKSKRVGGIAVDGIPLASGIKANVSKHAAVSYISVPTYGEKFMSVVVVVNIESKQGRSEEALKIIKKSQELCLSMEGCTSFEVLQSQGNDHRFSFIERWVSTDIHKAFLEQLMSNEEFVKSMEVFTSGPNIEYFNIS